MTSNNCSGCGTAWYPGVEVVQHRGQSPRHRQSPRRRQKQAQSGESDWTYAGGWDYAGYGGQQNGPWAGNGPPLQKMQSPRQKTLKSTAQSEARKKTKPASSNRRSGSAKASHVPDEEPDWDMDPDENEDDKAPPSTTATSTEAKLQRLVAELQKSDQPLDEGVQDALTAATVISTEESSRKMQSAASRLANARDQLLQARQARDNLHRSWAKFIADAVQRWNQHSEKFAAEDAKVQESIQKAIEKIQTAKQDMETSKEELSAADRTHVDIQEVSDEELMMDATPQISTDIQTMVASFDKIRARQAESFEESANKKQKVGNVSEKPKEPGKGALEPFGGGGK